MVTRESTDIFPNKILDGSATVNQFSIVMPAYNEENVIEQTLHELIEYLDNCDFRYEIIVVNDASTDQTETIINKIAVIHSTVIQVKNKGPNGYGHAIRKGLEIYKGDAVVIVTSDGSDSPKDVAAYFHKIQEGFDCVFGSRFLPGTKVSGYPRFKLILNRLSNRIISWILHSKYNDFTNGFKCYRRHVIEDIQPLITGQFNITIELSVSATLGGWNYAVIPNDWTQRNAGDSSFRISQLMTPYLLTLVYCLTKNYLTKIRR